MMFYNQDEDEDSFAGDELYEECEVCHQEYHGVCPINSADCPYAEDEEDEEDLVSLDDDAILGELIGDDEEIEKIIEEEVEIPVEDLIDEEDGAETEGDDTPGKTVEELEAEAYEQAQLAKKRGKAKASSKTKAAKAKPASKKPPAKKAPTRKSVTKKKK